jgi:hypothetical protein
MSQTRRLAAILAADVAVYSVRCGLYPLPSLSVARDGGVGRIYLNQIDTDTAIG